MHLLRPAFDAACAALSGTPLVITAAQREALWELLVPTAAQTRAGRQRWTATAHALRAPLQREINTVKHQLKDKRFDGEFANLPGKPPFDLCQMHRLYAARLTELLLRIDTTMRANGHFCLPGDEQWTQPIEVIVANERQANRPAGVSNWTQWEDPATVRKMTRIFAEGPRAKRGAQWAPYMPDGTRRRGAAAEQKAIALWRGAFHDAVHGPRAALAQNPDAWPLVKFYESMKERRTQQYIDDAIQAQVAAHRSPSNPAFKNNIWLALSEGARATLAADYHAALLACREQMLAQGRGDAAAGFDPAVVPNPWALTEPEQEFRPEPVQAQVPAAKYDERPSTFDAVSNSTPEPDWFDKLEDDFK